MATSRLEKIGTIYSRITGLLRAGALKFEDRPIWYDVYEAFPPKNEPPSLSNTPLPKILYPEDNIRSKFHQLSAAHDTINLVNDSQTKCQKFISMYQSLEASDQHNLSSEELFNEALLKTKEQFQQSTELKKSKSHSEPSLSATFKNAQKDAIEKVHLSRKIDVSDLMKED